MFTGLVEELGTVQKIERGQASANLTINASAILEDVRLGDSIAVNGVCLTVVEFNRHTFTVEVMAETLRKTNLADLRPGDKVNLERALALGGRLGGHLVSGHIDGVGMIEQQFKEDIALVTRIGAPYEITRYLVPKGSVAVDGVSLTVTEVGEESFAVSLIPHTRKVTTLGYKRIGDRVNLEIDMIAKYVERFLRSYREKPERRGIDISFLKEHGFIDES
ncbi:riboflavin synthase [Calderihabitans maritimus]|uniref:Riboflavin synthase n=1 Tax=Calderihabitans maritimus TaxID=1246530 RepID=A0A1Z5HQ40_9FIRM|nr:riboflavin synthase [Calderihabitans maritimus]GAW91415.1 riboflavin synthase subunit alpha [Calderihabitans maritimus]